MISDEIISEDLRRDDPKLLRIHMVPDYPNAIWGLSLESCVYLSSFRNKMCVVYAIFLNAGCSLYDLS